MQPLHLANASLDVDNDVLLFLNLNPALFTDSRMVLSQIGELAERVRHSRYRIQQIVCEITEHRTSSPSLLTLLVETLRDKGSG